MGLRMIFSKRAKITGPTRHVVVRILGGQLQRGHRRPICAHKRSSVFTNAATYKSAERTDRQTSKQTDRKIAERQANRQTDDRLSPTTRDR